MQVRFEVNTAWLSQSQMAELFQTTNQNISLHVKNIFDEGELEAGSVVKDYLTTAAGGKKYSTYYYKLAVIISGSQSAERHGFARGFGQKRCRCPMVQTGIRLCSDLRR